MRLISRFLPRLPDDDCGNATDDGEHQAAGKEVKPGHGEHQDEESEPRNKRGQVVRM